VDLADLQVTKTVDTVHLTKVLAAAVLVVPQLMVIVEELLTVE
jgi:hypothetical protein